MKYIQLEFLFFSNTKTVIFDSHSYTHTPKKKNFMTDHSLLFLFYELTFLILNAIKRTSSKQNHNDSTNKQTKKKKKIQSCQFSDTKKQLHFMITNSYQKN